MDWSKSYEKPVKTIIELLEGVQPDMNYEQNRILLLRRNIIHAQDSWFHIIDSLQTAVYEFYDIGDDSTLKFQSTDKGTHTTLMRFAFTLDEYTMSHSRTAYGILNLFGDFGGVQTVLMFIGGYILGNSAEVNFNMKAISKLFLAKTRDDDVFKFPTKDKLVAKRLRHKTSLREAKNHPNHPRL